MEELPGGRPDREDDRPRFVSVIVPALNAGATLRTQLEALAAQTYDGPWEVVIADNGSTDDTLDVARAWIDRMPKMSIVDASARRSSNYARNRGALAASGDLLLFCDSDDVVDAGWIEAFVAASGSSDMLGGWYEDRTLNAGRSRPRHASDHLPTGKGFLPYALGGNLAVDASVFQALGGFREEYALGACEVEFCWRAQLASYTLSFVPEAVVRYRHRQGLRAVARQNYIRGQSRPRLYRDFRGYGMPKSRMRSTILAWTWIITRSYYLLEPDRRVEWIRRAFVRLGMLRGSFRYRVLYI